MRERNRILNGCMEWGVMAEIVKGARVKGRKKKKKTRKKIGKKRSFVCVLS